MVDKDWFGGIPKRRKAVSENKNHYATLKFCLHNGSNFTLIKLNSALAIVFDFIFYEWC